MAYDITRLVLAAQGTQPRGSSGGEHSDHSGPASPSMRRPWSAPPLTWSHNTDAPSPPRGSATRWRIGAVTPALRARTRMACARPPHSNGGARSQHAHVDGDIRLARYQAG